MPSAGMCVVASSSKRSPNGTMRETSPLRTTTSLSAKKRRSPYSASSARALVDDESALDERGQVVEPRIVLVELGQKPKRPVLMPSSGTSLSTAMRAARKQRAVAADRDRTASARRPRSRPSTTSNPPAAKIRGDARRRSRERARVRCRRRARRSSFDGEHRVMRRFLRQATASIRASSNAVPRRRSSMRNSRFPAGPSSGDAVSADGHEPERRARCAHARAARRDGVCGSRTTPPLPTRSRPASNCGLTSATIDPVGAQIRDRARQDRAQRDERRVDDDQVEAVGKRVVRAGAGSLLRSMTRTRGSLRSRQSSCP